MNWAEPAVVFIVLEAWSHVRTAPAAPVPLRIASVTVVVPSLSALLVVKLEVPTRTVTLGWLAKAIPPCDEALGCVSHPRLSGTSKKALVAAV